MNSELIIPPPLRPGDRIAICSPAGIARRDNVFAAMEVLWRAGFSAEPMSHAFGVSGSFSGTVYDRYIDLHDALLEPEVKAIICSRGGYGAVHLLPSLSQLPLRENAKWLVGFSDISALHALMNSAGIASIHGPMAKHISANGGNNDDFRALTRILRGDNKIEYNLGAHPRNICGEARARMVGGNLAVLQALVATPYDLLRPGTILLIEDIAEPIYKIERMLMQLQMTGVLGQLAGLIVGEFTDCPPDRNYSSVEAMIWRMVVDFEYPVAFGVPIGHGAVSRPFVEGAMTWLHVSPLAAVIQQDLRGCLLK